MLKFNLNLFCFGLLVYSNYCLAGSFVSGVIANIYANANKKVLEAKPVATDKPVKSAGPVCMPIMRGGR